MLDVLADELRNPIFPVEHIEKVRGLRMTAIANQENDTRQMAGRAFRETMFGAHPMGRDMLGDRQTVGRDQSRSPGAVLRDLVLPARG